VLLAESARAQQAELLAVVEQQDHVALERGAALQRARDLEHARGARAVVARARTGRDRVVVRRDEHGVLVREAGNAHEHVAHQAGHARLCDHGLLQLGLAAQRAQRRDDARAQFLVCRAADRMGARAARQRAPALERAQCRESARRGRGVAGARRLHAARRDPPAEQEQAHAGERASGAGLGLVGRSHRAGAYQARSGRAGRARGVQDPARHRILFAPETTPLRRDSSCSCRRSNCARASW
jgi:hypothetical protein